MKPEELRAIRKLVQPLRETEYFKDDSSPFNNFLSRMYYEDWDHGVLPISIKRNPNYSVQISPITDVNFVLCLFARKRRRGESIETVLRHYVSEVVQLLLLDSSVVYEICSTEGSDKLVLEWVDPKTLTFTDDKVIQRIKDERKQETLRIVDRTRVFCIDAPNWIEDGKGFAATFDHLVSESKRDFAPFNHLKAKNEGGVNYFDYAVFRERQEQRVLKFTKGSGLQARMLYDKQITEFYQVMRLLRFQLATTKIREHILECINFHLFPQLRELGKSIEKISLVGLPKSGEIADLQTKLERGDIGFKEAIDLSRRYS